MDPDKLNLDDAFEAFKSTLVDEAKKLGGKALDEIAVDGFAHEVTSLCFEALKAGDNALLTEARAQVPVLMQTYKLHGINELNNVVQKTITIGLKIIARIGRNALFAI